MTEVQRLNKFMQIAPEMIKRNTPLIDYITSQGFFKAPASTKYHGAYPGGLYDHSEGVFRYLDEMTKNLHLNWTRPESPFIIGLFHDLCKIDQYKEIIDNPGKTMFGETEPKGQEIHYEYRDDMLLKGHAVKSIMILSTFMILTEEEMLCIRYHMGAYEKDDWDGFDRAIRKYVNVLYSHTADMLESKRGKDERLDTE